MDGKVMTVDEAMTFAKTLQDNIESLQKEYAAKVKELNKQLDEHAPEAVYAFNTNLVNGAMRGQWTMRARPGEEGKPFVMRVSAMLRYLAESGWESALANLPPADLSACVANNSRDNASGSWHIYDTARNPSPQIGIESSNTLGNRSTTRDHTVTSRPLFVFENRIVRASRTSWSFCRLIEYAAFALNRKVSVV